MLHSPENGHLEDLLAHRGEFYAMATWGGDLLSVGMEDGRMKIWRPRERMPARDISAPEGVISAGTAGISPRRLTLATLNAEEDEAAEPEVPEELKNHVRERVAWAAEEVTDDVELQAVMSTMAYLLEEAGLSGEAEQLLEERMNDAHAPYYFMSWVAGMKSDAEQTDEAITWYRKAYDSSRGRYSRFRWGSIYLRRVMDLTPEAVDRPGGSFVDERSPVPSGPGSCSAVVRAGRSQDI